MIQIQFFPKTEEKTGLIALGLLEKYLFVGPYVSENIVGNKPWTFAGISLPYFGRRVRFEKIEGLNVKAHMYCAGPFAIVWMVVLG